MRIYKNVSLKLYSTMRLGGTADHMTEVKTPEKLAEAQTWAESQQFPVIVVGGGSNIVWRDEGFHGLLIVNKIPGLELLKEDEKSATYKIGAGEDWDSVVERLTAKGLSGIEALSLIPGTAGATPIQNVGAYGQEISKTLVSVQAFDTMNSAFVDLPANQCEFAYRSSRFKTFDKGRFLISAITLTLSKSPPPPPFYQSVAAYFEKHPPLGGEVTAQDVRGAVVAIRSAKLPDWRAVANNGSFFGNPIIDAKHYRKLKKVYKDVVAWELDGGQRYKVSAAWLIEKAKFKGVKDRQTGISTWPKQPLVLVNHNAKSTADLLQFRDQIMRKIEDMFGIVLEQEPEMLP